MAILNITTYPTGVVGVTPSIAYIQTNDTIDAVQVTGYLNHAVQQGYTFNESMMAEVSTKTSPSSASTQVNWFNITHSGGNWTLTQNGGGGGGGIVLPTTPNRIAHFTDTEGTLSDEPAAVVNAGTISSGTEEGVSGAFICYPGSPASSGAWVFAAQPNLSGNFVQYLQNSSVQQDCFMTVVDPGDFYGQVLVGATQTPFVDGNFPVASGVNGLMIDSGISAASVSDIGKIVYADIDVTAAALAGGGQVYVVAPVVGQSFKIRDVMCNASVGLSGGGGDHGLFLQDGTGAYAIINSTLTQSPGNEAWGAAALDFGVLASNRTTAVDGSFWFAYFGGTTDYTTGTINFTVAYERVT